jgi:hypothetical protein
MNHLEVPKVVAHEVPEVAAHEVPKAADLHRHHLPHLASHGTLDGHVSSGEYSSNFTGT